MNQQPKSALDHFLSNNSELDQLNAKLSEFNILKILRIENAEIRHSNILAWLLNPRESHGLGELVVKRFIASILMASDHEMPMSAAEVDLLDLHGVEVNRERDNIDILVVDRRNKFVLLIENKIYSGESKGQLARYLQRIRAEFSDYRLIPVFLTLNGAVSADESASAYICYDYISLQKTLEAIYTQHHEQMSKPVGIFIKHYLESMRRLTMEDESLKKLCRAIYTKHREAIDLIVEHGKFNNFDKAVRDALEDIGKNDHLRSELKRIWFIPNSWRSFLPENGDAWGLDPNIGVACWFFLDTANLKVELTFEISKMTDPKLRLACVKALAEAGFKLTKKAFSPEAKYSRFYHKSSRIQNINDEGETRQAVATLLENAKNTLSKAEHVLRKVFVN